MFLFVFEIIFNLSSWIMKNHDEIRDVSLVLEARSVTVGVSRRVIKGCRLKVKLSGRDECDVVLVELQPADVYCVNLMENIHPRRLRPTLYTPNMFRHEFDNKAITRLLLLRHQKLNMLLTPLTSRDNYTNIHLNSRNYSSILRTKSRIII